MCRHCEHNATHQERELIPAPAPVSAPGLEFVELTNPQIHRGQFILPFFGFETGYDVPEIPRRTVNGDDIPPVLIACSSCGEEHEKDRLHEHSQNAGEFLCDDCCCSCEECGEIYSSDDDDLHSAYNGDEYRRNCGESIHCESCSWKCDDCSNWFYGDGSTNASGEKICCHCAEQYSSCEDCMDTIHQDDSFYDENFAEGTFCRSCYEERERRYREENGEEEETPTLSSSLIRQYRYKPAPRFRWGTGENHEERTFYGLELETENNGIGELDGNKSEHADCIRSSGLADRPEFYCKSDSSAENGFEIVSHPSTLKYWMEQEFKFCGELRRMGYEGSSNCGLHIHVSRSSLSNSQVAKLLVFSRNNAGFMKFVSRRLSREQMEHYAPIESGSVKTCIRKARDCDESYSRYAAINLNNAKTIEFRLFQSTLNSEEIKQNIAFVACLLEFIRSAPLGRLSAADFLSFITLNGRRIVGRKIAGNLLRWLSSYPAFLAIAA